MNNGSAGAHKTPVCAKNQKPSRKNGMEFSDSFVRILGGELSLNPKYLTAVVCNGCCIRALVPGVFVFPSRVLAPFFYYFLRSL